MNEATVLVYDKDKLVFGSDYDISGQLTQSDLKEIVEDALTRNEKPWTKCGIMDDRGILLTIFDSDMNEIPRINPNEKYLGLLTKWN